MSKHLNEYQKAHRHYNHAMNKLKRKGFSLEQLQKMGAKVKINLTDGTSSEGKIVEDEATPGSYKVVTEADGPAIEAKVDPGSEAKKE